MGGGATQCVIQCRMGKHSHWRCIRCCGAVVGRGAASQGLLGRCHAAQLVFAFVKALEPGGRYWVHWVQMCAFLRSGGPNPLGADHSSSMPPLFKKRLCMHSCIDAFIQVPQQCLVRTQRGTSNTHAPKHHPPRTTQFMQNGAVSFPKMIIFCPLVAHLLPIWGLHGCRWPQDTHASNELRAVLPLGAGACGEHRDRL